MPFQNSTTMIEVFKTNVQTAGEASLIVEQLQGHFPGSRINFDLHDCDKILRVEGREFSAADIIALVGEKGYHCELLQ